MNKKMAISSNVSSWRRKEVMAFWRFENEAPKHGVLVKLTHGPIRFLEENPHVFLIVSRINGLERKIFRQAFLPENGRITFWAGVGEDPINPRLDTDFFLEMPFRQEIDQVWQLLPEEPKNYPIVLPGKEAEHVRFLDWCW